MYLYITMFYIMFYVCFQNVFLNSNLYLYNAALSVLFCVKKDIIIKPRSSSSVVPYFFWLCLDLCFHTL